MFDRSVVLKPRIKAKPCEFSLLNAQIRDYIEKSPYYRIIVMHESNGQRFKLKPA